MSPFFKCSFTGFFMVWGDWKPFFIWPLKYIDGRCSYRETWFPSLSLNGCVPFHVLLTNNQTSSLFICSLKLGVDTEKPQFQKAALNTINLEFLLTWLFFSVLLEAPECSTEKLWSASRERCHRLPLMAILQLFFFVLDYRYFFGGLV